MKKMTDYDAVPYVIKIVPHWVLWKRHQRGDRLVKIPYSLTGAPYKPGERAGLASFDEARRALDAQRYDGLGFALFPEARIVGIDVDWKGRYPKYEVPPMAEKLVRRFGSYAEFSPSGYGLHILVRGTLPEGHRNRIALGDLQVEVYTSARYLTVTGAKLPDAPGEIALAQNALDAMYDKLLRPPRPAPLPPTPLTHAHPDEEVLERAFNARNGKRVKALYYGDTSGYPSPSEADLALAGFLAFWTGDNPDQLERLMLSSRLKRPKWEEKRAGQTYLRRTVLKAIQTQRNFWRRSA